MAQEQEEKVKCLQAALDLALARLIMYEPPDSRGVSDEFVAMAMVAVGLHDKECMDIINSRLETIKYDTH